MNAKKYLLQAHTRRKQIAALEEQIEHLITKANEVKAIRIDAGKAGLDIDDPLQEVVVKLIDTANRYAEKVLVYAETIDRITNQIEGMDDEQHVEFLTLRYLQTDIHGRQYSLFRIADIMHRSPDRVKHIHSEALAAFQKKYLTD